MVLQDKPDLDRALNQLGSAITQLSRVNHRMEHDAPVDPQFITGSIKLAIGLMTSAAHHVEREVDACTGAHGAKTGERLAQSEDKAARIDRGLKIISRSGNITRIGHRPDMGPKPTTHGPGVA